MLLASYQGLNLLLKVQTALYDHCKARQADTD